MNRYHLFIILMIFRIEVAFACSCGGEAQKIETNFPIYSISSLASPRVLNETHYLFFQSPMVVGNVNSLHETAEQLEVYVDVERNITQFESPPEKIRIIVPTVAPKGVYCYCLPDVSFYRRLRIGKSYIFVGKPGGVDESAFANTRIIFDANIETLKAFSRLEQFHLQAPKPSAQRVALIKTMALNKPEQAFYSATHPKFPISVQEGSALQTLQEEILSLNPQLDSARVLLLLASEKMAAYRRNDKAAQSDFLFFAAEAGAAQKNYTVVLDAVKQAVKKAVERPRYNRKASTVELSNFYARLLGSQKLKAFWFSDLGKASIEHVHSSFYKLMPRGAGGEHLASAGKKSFFAILSGPRTTTVRILSPLTQREESLFEGGGAIKWKLRPLVLGVSEEADGAAVELQKLMTIRTAPFSEKKPVILKTIILKCREEICRQTYICNAKSLLKSKEGMTNLLRQQEKNASELLYLALLGDRDAVNQINQPQNVKHASRKELSIMRDWFKDYLLTCDQ